MIEVTREKMLVQKVFPVVNNSDLLEFRIPAYERGQLDLENVMLHFTTRTPVDDEIIPENFFGSKQFSSVEIRINGEAITRRSCANEYFLGSYFKNLCNYQRNYLISAMKPAGIFDYFNKTTEVLETLSDTEKTEFKENRKLISDELEIMMAIDSSIFGSRCLLPSRTPLDISFERAGSEFSSVLMKKKPDFSATPNTLKDVYLLVPFVRDENTFQLERNAIAKSLKIHYDDYSIRRINIPKGSTKVRFDNVITGELPSKMFWGIQSIESYGGSFHASSTRFNRQDLVKANLYVDGQEVTEFPVTMSAESITQPYMKFLNNTDKYNNGYLGSVIDMNEFADDNFILSASFNSNISGAVTFEFDFSKAINSDLVLVICIFKDHTLKIDHNRNFQLI
jgi:hypothetical protein